MQKLKLELDSLHVESFDTGKTSGAERGTVRAHVWAHTEDHAGLWTFGACDRDVIVLTNDCIYSDICSLGCAETSDCPITP